MKYLQQVTEKGQINFLVLELSVSKRFFVEQLEHSRLHIKQGLQKFLKNYLGCYFKVIIYMYVG